MFLYDKYDSELPKILAIQQHDESGFSRDSDYDLPPSSPFDQRKQPDRSHHLEAARRNHFRGKYEQGLQLPAGKDLGLPRVDSASDAKSIYRHRRVFLHANRFPPPSKTL
jgi:hypothetical protein